MAFKVFPTAGKVPLISDWQQLASDDPEQLARWQNLYRGRMTHWAVPTGPINGILVLDVDLDLQNKGTGNGYETLKQHQLPATMSQRTPSGGMHYIFKYPSDGKRYGNKVKFLPGLDTRGEGGFIVWYGGDEKPILDPPTWLSEKTTALLSQPASQVTSIKVSPAIADRMIQESLDKIREAPPGEANNVLNIEAFKLGQLVYSQSITRDYAFEALFRAAKARGKPDYESTATINSGLDGGSKKPLIDPFAGAPVPAPSVPVPDPRGVSWTPAATTREELLDYTKLRKPQLFENWSTEDIHLTTADGGTGKTTMKLFEAICLALGDRFLGFKCNQQGKTLYITGEDTAAKLKAMMGQILRQMGYCDSPDDNEKVEIVQKSVFIKKDADLCLIVKDRANNFLIPSTIAMDKVMQAVDEIKPKLIVFDPISSFWGSESSLNDMAKAVTKFMSELADRSGACVEMINHMGKQSSSQKDMTQFSGRGGTGLPSHSRVVRTLRPIGDEEYAQLTGEPLLEKQSAMQCYVSKFSDGSPLYNKPFLILRDGFLFSRKNMTEAKAREAEQKLTDVERVFQFIQECRDKNKFPSRAVVTAFFKTCGNPIPKSRTESALDLLHFQGHIGDKIMLIENPDQVAGGKVYVITDLEGKE